MRYRAFVAPSYGYFFLRDADKRLLGEFGPAYVHEDRTDRKEEYLAYLATQRLNYQFTKSAKLVQFVRLLHSLEDTTDFTFDVEVSIESTIISSIALVLTFRDS